MDRMYDKAAEMQIYVYETIGQLEIHVYNLLDKKITSQDIEHGFNLFFAYYISSSVKGFWYIMIYMHIREIDLAHMR